MPYKLTFKDGSDGYLEQTELDPKEVERRRYAFPEERKFPLTDASKVMSAIKFFNYVDPKNERHLANAILKRMEELGISEVNVGPNNRFKKYYEAQDGYLQHFGVKGMHWGVRNAETQARYSREKKTSFRTNRKAKKDAKEFARAKMYYGRGAGTRRKLIKNQVEQRSKDLPGYSEAFAKHLASQDMGKAVKSAKRTRKRNDIAYGTGKTARGVTHAIAGNPRHASAAALAIVGAARVTGADKKIAEYTKKGIRHVAQQIKR